MKTAMGDFDLLPSSDLLADENKVKLYHYCNAIRGEIIDHWMNMKEMIPFMTVWSRLAFEFSMTEERIHELWCEGADIVEGPLEDDLEDAEVDEELVNDFIEFIREHAAERAVEDDLFRSIMDED